jgi:hypothetical protein
LREQENPACWWKFQNQIFKKRFSSKFRSTENSNGESGRKAITDNFSTRTAWSWDKIELDLKSLKLEETVLPQWTAPLSRGPTRLAGPLRSSTEFSNLFSVIVPGLRARSHDPNPFTGSRSKGRRLRHLVDEYIGRSGRRSQPSGWQDRLTPTLLAAGRAIKCWMPLISSFEFLAATA